MESFNGRLSLEKNVFRIYTYLVSFTVLNCRIAVHGKQFQIKERLKRDLRLLKDLIEKYKGMWLPCTLSTVHVISAVYENVR